jgi:ActD protein
MNSRYGTLAMYPSVAELRAAMQRLREMGCTNFEVFTPFPSEEVDELLPGRKTRLGWVMLIAGILGGSGAYFMQWYACRDYPLNVGGRPLNSWPSYVPVTFELTVLSAALVGLAALLIVAHLPRLDYPTFASENFRRASQDRYFLCFRDHPSPEIERRARDSLREGAETIEEIEG